jgi:hypothetical protein
MNDWPQWAGDLPTWITTIAIGLAALQLFTERKKRAAEEARESKAQASELTSWTVSDPDTKTYGVVFSNSSRSTFHDVLITAKIHGDVKPPIKLTVLPPGVFFVQHSSGSGAGSDNPSSSYVWAFPIDSASYAGWLRPYMNSAKYQVMGMTFKDNLKQSWATDSEASLIRA